MLFDCHILPHTMSIEQLKESIKSLSSIPELFSSQASSCEAMYKNKDELKRLVQDRKGSNEFLQAAEMQCTQTILDFQREISGVMSALQDLWSMQSTILVQTQEVVDLNYQVLKD